MASTSKSRLPDFLIVGAMKAGTSTLFRDLQTQRQIYFPYIKEPNNLCYDDVLSSQGIARYSELFHDAGPDQLCGEASTNYSKLPRFSGVIDRARQILPSGARIIYVVREPVARTLSHHRDQFFSGKAPADFEEYLRQSDHPINVSRYAMQIEPWIEAFGRQQVHIVQLETYARHRHQGLHNLCHFLEIRPELERFDVDAVYHSSKDRAVIPTWLDGPLGKVRMTRWFQRTLRPSIPKTMVTMLKKTLLKAPPPPPPPRPAVVDQIIEAVRDDAEQLRQIMGRDEPLWDFDAVRTEFVGVDRETRAV